MDPGRLEHPLHHPDLAGLVQQAQLLGREILKHVKNADHHPHIGLMPLQVGQHPLGRGPPLQHLGHGRLLQRQRSQDHQRRLVEGRLHGEFPGGGGDKAQHAPGEGGGADALVGDGEAPNGLEGHQDHGNVKWVGLNGSDNLIQHFPLPKLMQSVVPHFLHLLRRDLLKITHHLRRHLILHHHILHQRTRPLLHLGVLQKSLHKLLHHRKAVEVPEQPAVLRHEYHHCDGPDGFRSYFGIVRKFFNRLEGVAHRPILDQVGRHGVAPGG
mmetsp:Transcript_124806/g.285963  ORF Transcript_124806/g.285963 Transcript_124806/m.285963 type:complete len:269 (+) Transcript_124806:776-1582(+)